MSIVSLAETKAFLSITSTDYDALLTTYIANVDAIIKSIIWNVESADVEEVISTCDIWIYWNIFCKNNNITALKKIEWVTYTWVLNTDYKIINWTKLIIRDVNNYLTWLIFNYFTLTYTAGWATVPSDLKLCANIMIQNLFNNKDSDQNVIKYTLWPRSISFSDAKWKGIEWLSSVSDILQRYKVIVIKH
jgi:hypothetical protein